MKNTKDELIEAEINETRERVSPGFDLALPGNVMPGTLHLLPLTERPFFPAQSLPLILNEEAWLETVQGVGDTPHHAVGLALIRTEHAEQARPADFHVIGTAVRMHHPMRADGRIQFVAEGLQRFRIVTWLSRQPPFLVQVDYPESPVESTDEIRAYALAVINTIKELVPLNPLYSEELKFFLNRFSPNEPSPLADFAATLSTAPREALQDVLETLPILRRMEKVLVLLKKELEVAKLQAKIREQVEETMSEQQRKFFLREQLRAIQKELGLAKDDRTADLDRFRGRLEKLELPEAARARVDDELEKLAVLESGTPEYAVTRNYLDWASSLPWGVYSESKLDLESARKRLDQDHDGLDDVKERILEFLAVGIIRGEVAGSILLLVGPPGVGKTSLGRSIATALGRKFYRFSLGGMRDEAEIKGHRRTYIGAMPGKPIQALKEVGVANPVIMLDEIDKIGASFLGDPASALLEVLDPEQNAEFLDHYLDMRFDLSKILFVCTANQLDTVPAPLLDRMEIIRLAGYVTAEKVQIARHHLWPQRLARAGIKASQLRITTSALRHLVEGYAREAGVRNLEKQLGRITRKAAVRILRGERKRITVGVRELQDFLGKPVYTREKPFSGIGITTGLAWTPLGGVTLNIEATLVHTRNRGLKLTGQLGDVMKESAEIAYSYISSRLKRFHGDPAFFDDAFVHLHVPEGATPKDGPSAGVTMATALLSLARKEAVHRSIAMTGELTLTGRILAVGGIREKVTAALRNKVTELILPEANRRDFDELPEYLRAEVTAHFVKRYPDLIKLVFPQ
ncbi:MAG: endopeptidase La [Chromatiales bacterium 21-64-14]|nr:MAG: endopeptidase La [Chromatiales bacterium 21-64-14]HQU14703.1 endopeptidase La [Gammaproteobacteria bacterium]